MSIKDILITNRTSVLPGDAAKHGDSGDRPRKRHKYAVAPPEKRTTQGTTFQSKREMEAFLTLQRLEKAGAIQNLRRQVRFTWDVTYSANGQTYQKTESYIADFTWLEGGEAVTADAKGVRTREYKRKREIMRALFGIEIREL